MAADVPQFARPFRILGGECVVHEQDSDAEIMDCIETVLVTPEGSRDVAPDFGTPDQVFSEGHVDVNAVTRAVTKHEPRADVIITEQPDRFDQLVRNVRVSVRGASNG